MLSTIPPGVAWPHTGSYSFALSKSWIAPCPAPGALLLSHCSQVEPTLGFFRVSTISEVCITLAELRIWFLLPFSFFNVDFLAEMWLGEECFIVCSQPAQETRSVRLGIWWLSLRRMATSVHTNVQFSWLVLNAQIIILFFMKYSSAQM